MKRVVTPPTTALTLPPATTEVKLPKKDLPAEFKKILNQNRYILPYSELIGSLYANFEYQPVLVKRFLPQRGLQSLLNYLEKSGRHGLDTNLFYISDIKAKLAAVKASNLSDTLEVYQNLTKLEIAVAGALVRYSMILQYGLVDPAKVYPGYSIPTLRVDTNAVMHVFEILDLKKYLDSLQPKSRSYLALQKALSATNQDSAINVTETQRSLRVNLERLRWKNKPLEQKFVMVNIANFSLDVINKGKSMLRMKVCVGEKGNRATPQIGSMIFRIQVNPVWNIPQSIARDEISKFAALDKYYLANNNINVYKKGVLIQDPESINWSTANLDQYAFQQQPGPDNALGKIKFLFENKSSVYLHDTPFQKIFDQQMRAVSHGCVRVEKPLELAYALFGKGPKYQLIEKAMADGYPRAKFIDLPQQIPIRIDYYTVGFDDDDNIEYYKDIYELDPILYQAMGTPNFYRTDL